MSRCEKECEDEKASLRAQVAELEAELEDARNQLAQSSEECEAEKNALRDTISNLEAELERLRDQVRQAEAAAEAAREDLARHAAHEKVVSLWCGSPVLDAEDSPVGRPPRRGFSLSLSRYSLNKLWLISPCFLWLAHMEHPVRVPPSGWVAV